MPPSPPLFRVALSTGASVVSVIPIQGQSPGELTVDGTTHQISGPASGLDWDVSRLASSGVIEIIAADASPVPEPAAGTLVGGLIALAWCLGRSRRSVPTPPDSLSHDQPMPSDFGHV